MSSFIKQNKIPLLLSTFFSIITFLTISHYGITWDEPYYYESGVNYIHWIQNPLMSTIDQVWGLTDKHPPFYKFLAGITHAIFSSQLHLLNDIDAFRSVNILFVFLATYIIYKFSLLLKLNNKTALFVSSVFFFTPRVFFETHLATLDFPITALWLLVIYCYLKGMENTKWILVSAVFLGFAFLTKITSVLILFVIIIYWSFSFFDELLYFVEQRRFIFSHFLFLAKKIIPIVVLSPIVTFLFWPWLWSDTIEKLEQYILFHSSHFKVPVYYFGTTYNQAPWHYPLILTLITLPLIILFPFFIGLLEIIIKRNKLLFFLFINAALPIVIASLPNIPKYDGVRLFLPIFPFICLIAGIGIQRLMSISKEQTFQIALSSFVLIAFIYTLYTSIVKIHPYQSSYYNELIGGIDGATKAGFETEYWGNAYKALLPWINDQKDKAFWVPLSYDAFTMYKKIGLLKDDIVISPTRHNSEYLILLSRQGFFDSDSLLWSYYYYEKLVSTAKLSKTNLVGIYKIKR